MSNPKNNPLFEAGDLNRQANARADAKKVIQPDKMDPHEMDQQQLALIVAMGEMAKKMKTHGVMMIGLNPAPDGVPGSLAMAAEFFSLPELMERDIDQGQLTRIACQDPTKTCWFMIQGEFIERSRADLIQEAEDLLPIFQEKVKHYQEKKAEAARN